jgi:hypothetical protein
MPSPEAKLLSDFLLAPAALRDFMTLRQFTDIFPKGHRANPAVHELYRELERLREKDLDAVRRAIADEVSRSKQLRREYAGERRRLDDATVAGLDPIALSIEEEVSLLPCMTYAAVAAANPPPALGPWPQEATYLHVRPRRHPRSMPGFGVPDCRHRRPEWESLGRGPGRCGRTQ